MRFPALHVWAIFCALCLIPISPRAAVYNLKVVTDASPDYSDMESMIRSITTNWETPEQKCWAMFYWNHIARRQTTPMMLHGMALTDPIRQFNDYGYAMCSTISGINCSIWDAMGLKTKYWDISNHTVSEVEYGGRYHMYDNSLSALYTLCDGKTLAGVEDIGRTAACEASEGRSEPGHVAKYHCITATSRRGFLSGADTIRSLDEEYRCFNPNGLKYRFYFYDWDRGHRYILNLRDGESYTRHYRKQGESPDFYVPNTGKDPEAANKRYRIRGNGAWVYEPALRPESIVTATHSISNVIAAPGGGVTLERSGTSGEVVFKIDGANVITALKISGRAKAKSASDRVRVAVSTVNGLVWRDVWESKTAGEQDMNVTLVNEVNGAYEVLVKVVLTAAGNREDAVLKSIRFDTTTMLNSKTQPNLAVGRNTIHVGVGDQTESIVYWPDLQGTNYKAHAVEEQNIATSKKHPGYMGTMYAAKAKAPAWVVFKLDAPRDITRFTYGGRLYNRAPRSRIDFLHSIDAGKTWARSYTLTNTEPPWDVIRYATVDRLPPGTRSVLFKYLLEGPDAGSGACSIYAVRMEVNHAPVSTKTSPMAVTFDWSERQADYSLVQRSHTEIVRNLPHRYVVNVGGADHPVVTSLRVAAIQSRDKAGYSDGTDVSGQKYVPRWVTYGKNLAEGKRYAVSVPSDTQWGAGDPDGKRLTDGVVGPAYPGGTAPGFACLWNKGQKPEITVDLGETQKCGAFRIHLGAGWPWWDAMKGEFKDRVEVLTSEDGKVYKSHGFFELNLRWKDMPVNHMWPDEEVIASHNFEMTPAAPVQARYVQYRITPQRSLTVSEVQVLDEIRYEPFDLRLAMP